MSDNRATARMNAALQKVDSERRLAKFTDRLVIAAATFTAAVAGGWYAMISWALTEVPGISKTGSVWPMSLGLVVLSVLACVAVVASLGITFEQRADLLKAESEYLDAVTAAAE